MWNFLGLRLFLIPLTKETDIMDKLKSLLEKSAFGVCQTLGHKMGIASSRVRLYFIYLTFGTLGSPVIIYLFLAFWINVKEYINQSKKLMWD
jgi:phage shock protein PspC (stress-responsive transcriptional regulator)